METNVKKYFIFLIICACMSTWVLAQEPLPVDATTDTDNKTTLSSPTTKFKKLSWKDNFKFSQIPILHSGRVKPLSTFAREYLLVLYEKSSLPNMSAEQWLAETVFDPKSASDRLIFKIRNPEIADILNIKKNKKNIYSFNELSKALDKVIDLLNKIKNKREEEKSLSEKQLLNLYIKVLSYFQLKQSLSLILPLFSLESSVFSKKLGMIPDKHYNYLEMVKFQQKIVNESKRLKKDHFKNLSKEEQQLVLLSYKIDILSKSETNSLFKIIPPQWDDNKELWYSPWVLISEGKGSPLSATYLNSWIDVEKAYRTGKDWREATKSAYKNALEISKGFSKPTLLYMEKIFNDINFFQKSLILYILAFLLLSFSFIFFKNVLYKSSFIVLVFGFLLHLIGLIFRVVIMGRPPVSTLYESILFVGMISVGLTIFLEKYSFSFERGTSGTKGRRQLQKGMGLLMGSIVGTVLHFIGFKYKEAESMSLLVPVLNTNFWLATHVVCITIGYGCAIVTSLMGHVYVFIQCLNKWKKSLYYKKIKSNQSKITKKNDVWENNYVIDLSGLYKNMNFASFVALFFCLFGTILGGIWADQSWGRFWGWDPKENGALAIVIWLLVLIHGRLAGILKKDGYALGMIFTNIVVALSWFGVNLLSIGLHSYGFISGVFWGLIIFCGSELLFASSSCVYLRKQVEKGDV